MMITAVYFQARPVWCFQSLYVPTGARALCKIWGRGSPLVGVGPSSLGLADWTDKNSESAARLVRWGTTSRGNSQRGWGTCPWLSTSKRMAIF